MSENCRTSCAFYHALEGEIVDAEQARQLLQDRLSGLHQTQDMEDAGATAKLDTLNEWEKEFPPEAAGIFASLRESVGKVYADGTDLVQGHAIPFQLMLDTVEERLSSLTAMREKANDTCAGPKPGSLRLGELLLHNNLSRRPAICRGNLKEGMEGLKGKLEQRLDQGF